MADHYRILGLTKNATKDEVKQAFRKLAIQFHPDKHAQSPKSTRDAATTKFKQLSEAYEVLIDDRQRASYNLSRNYNNYNHAAAGGSGGGYSSHGGGYSYSNVNGSYYYKDRGARSSTRGWGVNLEGVFMYMRTRSFLLNVAFASILLGGIVAVDKTGENLWKLQNSGEFRWRVEDLKAAHVSSSKRCQSIRCYVSFPVNVLQPDILKLPIPQPAIHNQRSIIP